MTKKTSKKTQKKENKSTSKNKKTTSKKNNSSIKKTTHKKNKETTTKKSAPTKKTAEKEKTPPPSNLKTKTHNKPQNKKEYKEEKLLDEKIKIKEALKEEEEVTEVEEIDISNIEPIIAEDEPLIEDEEEYVPKTRGRKKRIQVETPKPQTMEEIIRNRPLQIDPTQKTYVTKKDEEPTPYITPINPDKTRYSDEELQEFKKIILDRLKETKENYEQLKKYFTNTNDNSIEDTSPTFKIIEDGSDVMTKEEIVQQLIRLVKYMIYLQNALISIENKTYGICTVTGKLIPKERLKLVPHATKSIEAKISRDT